MSRIDEVIMEFVKALHETEDLDRVECALLSNARSNPKLISFLKLAFKLERESRPFLLEMKGEAFN